MDKSVMIDDECDRHGSGSKPTHIILFLRKTLKKIVCLRRKL